MRFSRQAYLDLMTFGHAERPMFAELFGPLIGLPEEWRAQGATQDEIDMVGWDWDYVPYVGAGANCAPKGGGARVVLEETADYRLERDQFGRTLKLDKRTATIPLPLNFPVKTMDDWLRLKPMFTYRDDRLDWAQVAKAKQLQAEGHLVVAGIAGGYDMVRELMGEELGCMAYYEQPELIADIMATLTDTATRVLQRLVGKVTIDQLSVHEDFAGKSGPLIGPTQIRQHLRPYYRACWAIAQEAGAQIFQQDTDGNVNAVIDDLLDCGLTCIFPMEPAAGMDIVALRRKYGRRLAMLGGLDKHALRHGREAIRKELEYKLQPLMRDGGGMVFGLDHRIPNGTPLEAYRYYVQLGRELLGLPPRDPQARGWGRMAF
jgi:uroporphyrinogen-III decarboxylase